MPKRMHCFVVVTALCVCFLCACQDYQVTVNERPVYQPPALIEKIALADAALETCIEQTIHDQRITDIKNLNRLRCSSTGVRSLAGLEQLFNLQELDVSSNDLNKIDSLLLLPKLTRLRVVDNANLDCNQLRLLKAKRDAIQIEAPSHCDGVEN